jgi:hypothetical protein
MTKRVIDFIDILHSNAAPETTSMSESKPNPANDKLFDLIAVTSATVAQAMAK